MTTSAGGVRLRRVGSRRSLGRAGHAMRGVEYKSSEIPGIRDVSLRHVAVRSVVYAGYAAAHPPTLPRNTPVRIHLVEIHGSIIDDLRHWSAVVAERDPSP
jgi:hypothetical protein